MATISRRLPDGKPNPAYYKQYREKRKADGNPIKQAKRSTEYNSECTRRYRATTKGKAAVKKWNESAKGQIARKKYKASLTRYETGDEYASRIMREINEISKSNQSHP
jgi:hypothetical protein